PPMEAWGPIQAIRRGHDRSHPRWMPHMTLLYGFLPERLFGAAEEILVDALRAQPPFSVRLSRIRRFSHPGSVTLWLDPEVEWRAALIDQQARLFALFPSWGQQSTKSDQGFPPHLKVAQFHKAEADAAARASQAWQQDLPPLEFQVEAVYLISRRDDDP